MFAQKNRISKQREFENIFKNGKTIKGGFFKILFLENNKKANRFSVIVNKKVSKNAVVRNRIKRLIRKEIVKKNLTNKSLDIVFIIYPNINQKLTNISEDVQEALGKI